MNIRKLDWDSNFFGLRIGRADIETQKDVNELTKMYNSLHGEFDLIYVFDKNHIGFRTINAELVDEKVLYSKSCEHKRMYDEVTIYHRNKPTEALYHLAHVSGGHSRFKLDKCFPQGSFEKMYDKWIENACPKTGERKQIFVYNQSNITKGMITVDYDDSGLAHIGLASVDDDCQRSGIGTQIMSTLEEYLYQLGTIHTIEVPTQKANINACHWYEKNGFRVVEVIDIYHWWL
ncbi:MAG: GNAT family N-acetyltransferase [Paludibacteraceae bacterium]|nr:GNAT family N-acetyltransferase [Paludibacteraceae bacterium]